VQTDRRVVPVVARPSDAEAATEGARWVTRWRGWADWPLSLPLLALAAITVALDVTTAWTGTALGSLGRIATSPALPLALLLAVWVGLGRVGFSRDRVRAWREFALAVGVVLGLATVGYAVAFGRPAEAVGLVVAALGEELVYRFAAVIVFGALAARLLGRPWRNPRDWGTAPGLLGLLAAGALFSGLPGHVVQVNGPSTSVAFASLALLLGYTVLRTGTVWPAVLAHALLNLTTIATWQTSGPQGLRLALAATTLVALVAGADVAGRRLGLRRRVPTVIDLSRTSAPLPS
jgi:hypothetical protein